MVLRIIAFIFFGVSLLIELYVMYELCEAKEHRARNIVICSLSFVLSFAIVYLLNVSKTAWDIAKIAFFIYGCALMVLLLGGTVIRFFNEKIGERMMELFSYLRDDSLFFLILFVPPFLLYYSIGVIS